MSSYTTLSRETAGGRGRGGARGRGDARGGGAGRDRCGPVRFTPQKPTPMMLAEAEKAGVPTGVIVGVGCKDGKGQWNVLCVQLYNFEDVKGAVFDTPEDAVSAGYGDPDIYFIGHAREDGKVHVTIKSDEIRQEGEVALENFPAAHLEPDARSKLQHHLLYTAPENQMVYKEAARAALEHETGLVLPDSSVRVALVTCLDVVYGSVKKGTGVLNRRVAVLFVCSPDSKGELPALTAGKHFGIAHAHWLPADELESFPGNNVSRHLRSKLTHDIFDKIEERAIRTPAVLA